MEVLDSSAWRRIFASMPVTILVNLREGYYNVRDNTLMCVWADDLKTEQYDKMVQEMRGAWDSPGDRALIEGLARKRMGKLYRESQIPYFGLKRKNRRIQTEVSFSRNGRGEIFEIRISLSPECLPEGCAKTEQLSPALEKQWRRRPCKRRVANE